MAKTNTLDPGSKLGPYEIIRLIGKGGMGEVYEAYEDSLDRKVAIKIIPKELSEKDPEVVKRFVAEGKVLAQLNHPNVVVVHSLGQTSGIHYLAMEFVDGPSLKQRIKERTFELSEALPLFLQMIAGTDALHKNGIIHRDLKPANIIYKIGGSIKIVDLGIAKNVEDTNPEITKIGEVVGSPMYMSPEVALGEPASKQSDLWGLGLIFYEMLVGKNPYKASSQVAILKKITTTDLEFPKEIYVKLPIDIIKIIRKLCSRNPSARYYSANDVYREIEQLSARTGKKDFFEETSKQRTTQKTIVLDQTINQQKTKSTQIKSRTTKYSQEDAEDSKLKIYSLVYITLIAVFVSMFFNYKDKFSPDSIPQTQQPATPQPSPKQNITLLIKSPKPQETIILDKNNLLTINFIIKGETSNYRLQIAEDAMFSKIVLEKISPATPFKTSDVEADKNYYLRFVSGNSYSDTIPFSTTTRDAPQPVSPTEGQKFLITSPYLKDATFNIDWKRKINVDRYRVQVARDTNFKTVVTDQSVAGTSLNSVALPEGRYFWRVRAITETSAPDFWSAPIGFKIEASSPQLQRQPIASEPTKQLRQIKPTGFINNLKAPILTNIKIATILNKQVSGSNRSPASYNSSSPPVLTWQKVKGATSYIVQISNESSFLSLIVDTSTLKPSFTWRDLNPGNYFWRVYAKNDSGFTSSSSVIGKIEALLSAPTIDSTFSITSSESGRYFSKVQWQKMPSAMGYLVKVSTDPTFKSSVRTYKANEESTTIELDSANKHFLKVAAVSESGDTISQYSKPSLLAPEKRKITLNYPKINVPSDGSSLGANPGPESPVVFDWSPIDKATNYIIQISKTKNFNSVLFTEKTKENQIIFDKKLPGGIIFWRIRSEKNSDASPWSPPSSFEVPQ